jgi:hypothetical protein
MPLKQGLLAVTAHNKIGIDISVKMTEYNANEMK